MFVNIGYWDLPYMELVLLTMLIEVLKSPDAEAGKETVAATAA
jgi:hypothetical protein